MAKYRVTVDTGGTFSDFIFFDEETSEIQIAKLPSTPHEPSEAILQGVQKLLDEGVKPEEITYFCHGTTVGTNALLERKGVKTGLLVTEGFRGIYEVMEQSRPYGAAIFDVDYDKPEILVPQNLTGEVKERVNFQGEVLLPLDEAALRATLRELAEEQNLESVAVCLLFSFLNPRHEQSVKRIIEEEMPEITVSLSSEVIPQIREHYRLSTTVINAYLQPILQRYIRRLDERLREKDIHIMQKYIMQSNGGTSTFENSADKAVTTVLSGPAGGVTAGVHLSEMTGQPNLITFDMGGTSCDVALIRNGKPMLSNRGEIEGRIISLPMMEINTVSAGGGTIARVDEMGVLEVGPDSAGAVPGPACYNRGGDLPTITDANLVLGYLSEDHFLGGEMKLVKDKAEQAVSERIAKPLGMDLTDAAEGIIRIVNVKMEEAIKAISTMRGYDLREFMLVAFGGAGPLHAVSIAESLGMAGVIVPLYPGVNSALGLLIAEVKHDYIQSKISPLDQTSPEGIAIKLNSLRQQAIKELSDEGFSGHRMRIECSLDMRYAGQGYEISIPVPDEEITRDLLIEMRKVYDRLHKQLYGHEAEEEMVEIVSYRTTGIGLVPQIEMTRFAPTGRSLGEAVREKRKLRFNGKDYKGVIYERERLDVGAKVPGPAVIEQLDSTIVIPPGREAVVDAWKNLIISVANNVGKEGTKDEQNVPQRITS